MLRRPGRPGIMNSNGKKGMFIPQAAVKIINYIFQPAGFRRKIPGE